MRFTYQGQEQDLLDILRANGINMARLRLWHTPVAGLNDLHSTLMMAQRIHEAGLDLLLDFHYSDTWADPGHQSKPVAWAGQSFEALEDSIFAYSYQVINALVAQGTPPRMVQTGNEIIQGLLWDEGRVGGSFDTPDQWDQLARLLRAAQRGVKDASPSDSIEIMIHIDRGGDYAGATWFFDRLAMFEVDYDLIGLSYYPWWHGTMGQMEKTVQPVAQQYGKPVMLVEIAYPWTLQWFDNTNNIVGLPDQLLPEYAASPEGQSSFIEDVVAIMQRIPERQGRGVCYWAPEYVALKDVGSPWENLALFDNEGNALKGLQTLGATTHVGLSEKTKHRNTALRVYPNPFRSSLTLEYIVDKPAHLSIQVFDVLGRPFETILTSQLTSEGTHHVTLNTAGYPSGVYSIRLSTESGTSLVHQAVRL